MELLEIMGQVVGVVVSKNDNTLLIRKARIFHNDDDDILALQPDAVYCDKKLLNNYWVKLKPSSLAPEPLNCDSNRSLIRKLLDM